MAYNPSAPLLEDITQPTGQPVVIAQQQQPYYTQQPNQYQQPVQVTYGQPPQYQAQGQPVQYQQQPVQYQQPVQNQQPLHQPTDQQLGEGLGELAMIVKQPEPIRVHGAKDGVGMKQGCLRNPHILTWILTIGVWYMICSILICNIVFGDDGYCGFFVWNITASLGITAAIAIVYWIECICSGTGKYLSHILQNEGAQQFVERIKGQPAVIWWRVACYHYETRRRSRQVTDSNGNTRTEWETYQEKVYTWRARQQYRYGTCIDVSGQLVGLDEYKLTKLKLEKTYGFVDNQTQQDFVMQRRTFRMMNWRDIHQEFHEEFSIPGYVDRILAEAEPGLKPGWMSNSIYWLCNLLFMSPCFRHKMSAACGNAQYTFIKQLSAY